MSWQEELRKLDEDLASGKLSADDYRVRRDQVLSSAVSQGEDPTAQPPQSGQPEQQAQPATQESQQPQQGQTDQQAGQAQTSQDPTQGGGQSADSTQVISPVNQQGHIDPNAERTQVVPPWQAQQAQQQVPYQQPGQQFTGPGSPAGGFQPPQPVNSFQPGWNAAAPDQSPPWGGSEFPPVTAPSEGWGPAWGQMPEGGFEEPKKGNKGKIFAIVGVVVLLAGLGVGAYFVFGQGEDPQPNPPVAASGSQQPSTTKTSAQPEDALPIGELPGERDPDVDVQTFNDVPGLNYLVEEEVEAYQRAEPGNAAFAIFRQSNGNTSGVLLVEVGDESAASDEVTKLSEIQVGNGAKPAKNAPQGVQVTEYSNAEKKIYQIRGHYLSGNTLVRVDVTSQKSLKSARADFERALEAQLQVTPVES